MKNQVKAGFGKVDITPRVGVELCGYGPYLNRHSTEVLDPLYARAMAVELGGARWVLISCDLLALDEAFCREIRRLISSRTTLASHEVMVHATHTHSGPCTVRNLIGWGNSDAVYQERLPQLVAKAAILAVEDLKVATFFQAEVEASAFSYNRELPAADRTNEAVLEGKWQTDKPEETDTTATVIRVDRGGRVAGFLTYYSCHPVVCGASNREIHGDFVGLATNQVEATYPEAVGLFLQGAHGDINTNFVHGNAGQSRIALRSFAERFAQVIDAGICQGRPLAVDRVNSVLSREPCTLERTEEEDLLRQLADHEASLQVSDELRAGKSMVYVNALRTRLEARRTGADSEPYFEVQSFRLGALTLTATPLELMHRIKRRFQEQAGQNALLLSVTNGFLGYAPLREYYETPPERYAAYFVPYMLGRELFTNNFEDEVLLGVTRVQGLLSESREPV